MIKLTNHFKRNGAYANTAEDNELTALCRCLGARVSAERDKRGLKVQELSELLGLSPSYVTLMERGERMPSIRVFLRVCALFGLSPGELLETREVAEPRERGATPARAGQADDYGEARAVLDTLAGRELIVVAELLRVFRALCPEA